MDMQAFETSYGKAVAAYVQAHGHDARAFMKALYASTEKMKVNDGSMTNAQCFQMEFSQLYMPYDEAMDEFIKAFFHTGYYVAKEDVQPDPIADKIIKKAKAMGYTVALASNPYSPKEGTHARMRAAGLDIDDFALITTMENAGYCKPNLNYFKEVLQKLNKKPEQCLMVGNDVSEDMVAKELGMATYLVTTCMINKSGEDISRYDHGTLTDLYHWLKPIR